MKKIIIAIIAILGLLVAFIVISENNYKNNILPVANETEKVELNVNIPKGSAVRSVAAILESSGMIRDAAAFSKYCKDNGFSEKLQAGDYLINNSMNVADIVDKMVKGKVERNTVKVAIPEGYEVRQIADKLEKEQLINRDDFYEVLNNGSWGIDSPDLEGYLFPATYDIPVEATEEDIVSMMVNKFHSVYNEERQNRAKEMKLDMNEVITMASIIEREARVATDRKIIAGVFYNRLEKKMKLESCATVQFLLGERKEVLLYKDLEIDSPYNTYKNTGLPPAPIASPGEAAIDAALYPDDVTYLFFVAKPDGAHVFTNTYEEHLAAQRKINGK